MSAVETSEDWLLVARLLRGKVDERPEAAELAEFAEQEAARLDVAQAEERLVEEVAERMLNDHEGVEAAWKYAAEPWRETWRDTARSAIAHLRPIAEWLIAEERWSSKPYSLSAAQGVIAASSWSPCECRSPKESLDDRS